LILTYIELFQSQRPTASLDHLVGAGEERGRYREAIPSSTLFSRSAA
jgi:hypothetical protein